MINGERLKGETPEENKCLQLKSYNTQNKKPSFLWKEFEYYCGK